MRFPLAALSFIVAAFIFFVFWAVMSLYIGTVNDALTPLAPTEALATMNLIANAFGIICAIFFVTGVILIFVMDALADEPEVFYRRH